MARFVHYEVSMFVRVFSALLISMGLMFIGSKACSAKAPGTPDCMSFSEFQVSALEMVNTVTTQKAPRAKPASSLPGRKTSHNFADENFFSHNLQFGAQAVYLQFSF